MLRSSPITVLLADDHRLVRESLVRILPRDEMTVLADVTCGADAWQGVKDHQPDVAVFDVCMPAPDGIELARRITEHGMSTAVLILTMHKEAALVRRAFNAGARGVVLKDDAVEDLCYAIRTLADGRNYLSPSLSRLVSTTAETAELSRRELSVLQLVADGLTSREIGQRIGVGAKTVDTYRARAAQKLGVRNGPELIREALRQGLLSSQ